ncbi:Phosphoglycerate mutase-like protein AT74 [Glycine soja]
MAQGMTQTLHTGEHLHHVIGSDSYSPDWHVQFYIFPYARIQSTFRELRQYFLKKRIMSVREESRVQ